jgi:rare lipoprotein A
MRRFDPCVARIAGLGAVALGGLLLANCSQTTKLSSRLDPKYGVSASPRVIEPGQPVPKGGGTYRVGKPYVVGGKTYYPAENKRYRHEGTASWYGDDFHGRLTANGEIYDMDGISAAHPTLPMPSYARVTNLRNGRSLIVRINDRGPFHEGREIDLSSKAAQLLDFRRRGTARVRVEYVGPASLDGSDDRKLMATLREGTPASAHGVLLADARRGTRPAAAPVRRVASLEPQHAPVVAREREPEPVAAASTRHRPVVRAEPLPAPPMAEAAPPAHRPPAARARREVADAWPQQRAEPPARVQTGPIGAQQVAAARYNPRAEADSVRSASAPGRAVETGTRMAERGTEARPRLVWQTGPAPARVESAAAYAPVERNSASGRGLY